MIGGEPPNSHLRDGWDWPHGDADDVAEPVTDRLAVLPDGVLLRRTPPGQPTVDEVVQPGHLISAPPNDHLKNKVWRVKERRYYGLPAYTLALADVDQECHPDGRPKNYGGRNISELVYQDGAIRHLFANNEFEVEIVGAVAAQQSIGRWARP